MIYCLAIWWLPEKPGLWRSRGAWETGFLAIAIAKAVALAEPRFLAWHLHLSGDSHTYLQL